jgi:hypothetical protein
MLCYGVHMRVVNLTCHSNVDLLCPKHSSTLSKSTSLFSHNITCSEHILDVQFLQSLNCYPQAGTKFSSRLYLTRPPREMKDETCNMEGGGFPCSWGT